MCPRPALELAHGRSREGAWIEICGTAQKLLAAVVAPVRERGLKWCHRNVVKTDQGRSRKGTWIEMRPIIASYALALVAPARERGLKYGTRLDFRFC